MKFKAESDLVDTLKTCLKSTYNRSYIQILEEVSLGYGVADIVITELKTDQPVRNSAVHSLDFNDINIFSVIKNADGIEFNEIVEITRSQKRMVSQSVKKLLDLNYVMEVGGYLTVKDNYELGFVRNYAIEAKLKDWKRALKQAYRYKWFAEYSFVVLDAHYCKPALKNINVFEKYNVGLATVTSSGKLQRHFNPKKEMPLDPNMQILLSEKLKSYKLAK